MAPLWPCFGPPSIASKRHSDAIPAENVSLVEERTSPEDDLRRRSAPSAFLELRLCVTGAVFDAGKLATRGQGGVTASLTAPAAPTPTSASGTRSRALPSMTVEPTESVLPADGRAENSRSYQRRHDRACRHVSAHQFNSLRWNARPSGLHSVAPETRQPTQCSDGNSPARNKRIRRTADHGTRDRPASQ
jgi:hypothetical protein